jgi:hypothetical protein
MIIQIFNPNVLLTYIPSFVFILVLAIPSAYFLKAGLMAAKKDYSLPKWSEGSLFKKGFMLGLVSIIYSIPVMILSMLVLIAALGPTLYVEMIELSQVSPLESVTADYTARQAQLQEDIVAKLPQFIIAMIILITMSLLSWLIIIAAQMRFMDKGKFGSAFEYPLIAKIAFSGKYVYALFIALLLTIAVVLAMMILSFLLAITIIGIVLIPFVIAIGAYIMQVIVYTLAGQAYGEISK